MAPLDPINPVPAHPRRRSILKGVAAGLVLGALGPAGRLITAQAAEAAQMPFNAYLRIDPDSTVTVLSSQFEMGQGSYTGLATLVAEELDADWAQMRAEGVAGNEKLYGNPAFGGALQGTGGSSSTPGMWDRYRYAGATARRMLVQAAAQAWQVPAADIVVERGIVRHAAGHQATFGDLVQAAAALPVPTDVQLKTPSQWTLIGSETLHRLDTAAKSTGRQQYTIDVRLPGMLTAVVAHPPLFGAKVKSFDASAAKAIPGVVDVVAVARGVAVVAKDTWTAIKARRALQVEWDESGAETRGTDDLMAEYRQLATTGNADVARNDGDVEAAFAKSGARLIEAAYEFPYLAHAPMEPLNAVVRFQDGELEIWSGHQFPTVYQQTGAKLMGIPPEKVKLHVLMSGGSFGRRAVPDADFIVDAVTVLQATGAKTPIRMQWTREDDMAAGHYRPMYYHALRAALDEQGNVVAWHHRVVGQSIMRGTAFERSMVRNGVDGTSVEGGSTLPYRIPNLKVDLITTDSKTPVLWWRSVGSSHTAYSTEVFIDELAYAAKRDPVEFRRAMLKDRPRHLGVLNLVAEKAGWEKPAPDGIFRGIAVHESFHTFVAQVMEVRVRPDGGIKVVRAIVAVDCGVAVNPNVIRAQMEGGVGFALGAVMKSAITLDKGRVQEGNFDTYQVLTIDEMPKVEVHIMPSTERPTGVGEPGVPPAGPALANAVFAATGRRIRILPFNSKRAQSA